MCFFFGYGEKLGNFGTLLHGFCYASEEYGNTAYTSSNKEDIQGGNGANVSFFFLLNKKKLSKRAISLRIFGSVKSVKLINEVGKQGFAKAAK